MKGFEVRGKCSDNKAEECPFRKAKLAGSFHRLVQPERRNLSRKGGVDRHPATWSSPHSPCALAGYLKRVGSFRPAFFLIFRARRKAPPRRGFSRRGRSPGSRRRARLA